MVQDVSSSYIRIKNVTSARHTTVSLSPGREQQLRLLADRKGVGPRELLEEWIRDELHKLGTDEHGSPYWAPPGVSMTPCTVEGDRAVSLAVEGMPLTILALEAKPDPMFMGAEDIEPVAEAESLADGLERCAAANRKWEHEGTKYGGNNIYIVRRGAAVTLTIDDGLDHEGRITLSPTLAQDFAEALRTVAKEAELASLEDLQQRIDELPPGRARQLKRASGVTW